MSIFGQTQKTLSAKFPQPGAQIEGEIIEIGDPIQARKWSPDGMGELDTWPDGQPKMQAAIKLRTQGRDPEVQDDDGVRNLWVPVAGARKPGSLLNAINTAVAAAGHREPEIGGTLAVRFVQTDPQSKNPLNPRKMYEARYTPPASSGGWNSWGGDGGQQTPQGGAQSGTQGVQGGAVGNQAPQGAQTPQTGTQPQAAPQGGAMTPDQERMVDAMLAGNIAPEQIKAAAGVTDAQIQSRRPAGGANTGSEDQPPF